MRDTCQSNTPPQVCASIPKKRREKREKHTPPEGEYHGGKNSSESDIRVTLNSQPGKVRRRRLSLFRLPPLRPLLAIGLQVPRLIAEEANEVNSTVALRIAISKSDGCNILLLLLILLGVSRGKRRLACLFVEQANDHVGECELVGRGRVKVDNDIFVGRGKSHGECKD